MKHLLRVLFLVLFLVIDVVGAVDLPKVGIISGLSGAAAKWNRFQNMGIRLAQAELKQSGFPIELIVEDSATKAPRAISAYNKLFELDKVDAVIANDFGFAIAPLLPLVKKHKRLLVALSLPHDRYCNQAPGYFYSATSQFSKTTAAFDKFFAIHPKVNSIAIVAFDDPEWGNTYKHIWESIAKSRKIKVVDTFLSAELNPDFKAPLTKITAKNPDAILFAHEPNSFIQTVRQLGYKGLLVSANNILEMLVDSPIHERKMHGVYFVDPVISEDFRNKFIKRYGELPILEAYAGYEAMRSVAKAFQESPNHPMNGMTKVKYTGVAGKIDFTSTSCAGNWSNWGLFRFDGRTPRSIS